MDLTIEKAKEIIEHRKKQFDNKIFTQTIASECIFIEATGFIQGWNACIERIDEEINKSEISDDRKNVLLFIKGLRVEK